jgi:hypothetical protein
MKKLVILFVLAFVFNQNDLSSQSIVVPIGDEVGNVIDINATDIVLENRTTGEIKIFNDKAQLVAESANLSAGNFKIEYTANDERIKINNVNIQSITI